MGSGLKKRNRASAREGSVPEALPDSRRDSVVDMPVERPADLDLPEVGPGIRFLSVQTLAFLSDTGRHQGLSP